MSTTFPPAAVLTTSPESSSTAPSATLPKAPSCDSGFIIGPLADALLIIGAPLAALVIAGPLLALPSSSVGVSLHGMPYDLRQMLIVAFINAHLFLVFFRSHANQNIFRLYRLRFTVVPLGLIVLGASSRIALGAMGVLAVW